MTTTSSITVRINKVMGDEEYGLKDLEKLPLLEQVHRLYHAIQQKYPYKEVRVILIRYMPRHEIYTCITLILQFVDKWMEKIIN
jgi:hypothetical protein